MVRISGNGSGKYDIMWKFHDHQGRGGRKQFLKKNE